MQNTTGTSLELGDYINIGILAVGAFGCLLGCVAMCMHGNAHAVANWLTKCCRRSNRITPSAVMRAAVSMSDLAGRISPVAITLRVPPPPPPRSSFRIPPATLPHVVPPTDASEDETIYAEPADEIRNTLPRKVWLPISRLASAPHDFVQKITTLDAKIPIVVGRAWPDELGNEDESAESVPEQQCQRDESRPEGVCRAKSIIRPKPRNLDGC
jgi:hypothetical protein